MLSLCGISGREGRFGVRPSEALAVRQLSVLEQVWASVSRFRRKWLADRDLSRLRSLGSGRLRATSSRGD
jgi:hypothetical protein